MSAADLVSLSRSLQISLDRRRFWEHVQSLQFRYPKRVQESACFLSSCQVAGGFPKRFELDRKGLKKHSNLKHLDSKKVLKTLKGTYTLNGTCTFWRLESILICKLWNFRTESGSRSVWKHRNTLAKWLLPKWFSLRTSKETSWASLVSYKFTNEVISNCQIENPLY